MNKNVLIIVFQCWFCFLPAQRSLGLLTTLDSLNENLLNKKYFFFGESHYQQEETSVHQLKLVELLVKKGVKKINLYFENQPALIYFMRKFFEHQPDDYTIFEHEWYSNHSMLIAGLQAYKGKVEFKFIPMDICLYDWHEISEKFILELLPTTNGQDKKMSAKNRVAWASHLVKNSAVLNELCKKINVADKDFFLAEVMLLANYGMMKKSTAKSEKYMMMRDNHMAEVIDRLYSNSDDEVHIMTFGRTHITPKAGQVVPDIIQNLKKIERDEIVVLPIVYKNSFLNYQDKKYIWEIEKMGKPIEDGAADAILMIYRDEMWEEQQKKNKK